MERIANVLGRELAGDEKEDGLWRLQAELEVKSTRSKGKKGGHGPVTLVAIHEAAVRNSRAKEKKRMLNNPKISPEIDVRLPVVLNRLMKKDEKQAGLPFLDQYVEWLMEVLREMNGDRKTEGNRLERDCEYAEYREDENNAQRKKREEESRARRKKYKIEVHKAASGSGGQNMQKNASAVRVYHEPTGMKVQILKGRELEANKENAMNEMDKLIKAHIGEGECIKLLTDPGNPVSYEEAIWRSISPIVGDIFESDKPGTKIKDSKKKAWLGIKRKLGVLEEEQDRSGDNIEEMAEQEPEADKI